MRRIVNLMAGLLVLAMLSGCAGAGADEPTTKPTQRPYEIVVENGEYYLILDDDLPEFYWGPGPESGVMAQIVGPGIRFDSLEELRSDIETGNFTENELSNISGFDSDGDLRVRIFDNLYDIVAPEELEKYRLNWKGISYNILLRNGAMQANVSFINQETYNKTLSKYANFENEDGIKLLEKFFEEDRNATVLTYNTSEREEDWGRIYTKKLYSLNQGEKSLLINESYRVGGSGQEEDFSETIPDSVRIYGEENGIYFEVFLDNLSERPAVDWLLKWGATDCGTLTAG